MSGLRRDANPIYLVKLESIADSKTIRDKFGSSFKAGAEPLPPGLKGLSIRIRLTHATRVRIAIMQVLASHYKKSNPGSRTQVVNFEPRPLLRLTPPAGASDPRVLTFNFVEAVTKLPIKFGRKDYSYIMQTVSGKFQGQLRSLFVVISDDLATSATVAGIPRLQPEVQALPQSPKLRPEATVSPTPFRSRPGPAQLKIALRLLWPATLGLKHLRLLPAVASVARPPPRAARTSLTATNLEP